MSEPSKSVDPQSAFVTGLNSSSRRPCRCSSAWPRLRCSRGPAGSGLDNPGGGFLGRTGVILLNLCEICLGLKAKDLGLGSVGFDLLLLGLLGLEFFGLGLFGLELLVLGLFGLELLGLGLLGLGLSGFGFLGLGLFGLGGRHLTFCARGLMFLLL